MYHFELINVEEILAQLGGHSDYLLYAALFFVLLICGVGVPLPEDIPLITAGFLAYSGDIALIPAIIVSMVAILAGDSMIFYIGRRWGASVLSHRYMRRVLPERRLERVRKYFNRYGDWTVFFARFIVGLRAATFWAAGTMHVRYSKFVLFDLLAAVLSVPLWILLGWYFGDDIERALRLLKNFEMVFLVIAVIGVGALIYWEFRRRKAKRDAED